MKKNKTIKKAALKVPVLKNLILEKQELYKTTTRQAYEIKRLNKKVEELKRQLGDKPLTKKYAIWPLLENEVLKAEKKKDNSERPTGNHKPPFTMNWVIPAVVPSSGGQSDIFRTINYLIGKGHDCRIYIFDPPQQSNLEEQKKLIYANFEGIDSPIFYNSNKISDCDILFATHWLTAYPVYNFTGKGRKYYYVQGYEPHTQPAGYLGHLAEQTYTFGFRGLTLGQWLSEKLSEEYGMRCDYFDYGYDPKEYFNNSDKPRKDILYYAQPQKAHRGFELGIMALEIFHRQNPQSKIHLFGADLSRYKIPFPHEAMNILTVPQLNELYNNCATGLAISFTNISLIPLEMIAAGCQPVINDSYHTRKIKYSDRVLYANPTPSAIAATLSKAVKDNSNGLKAKLPEDYTWDHSNRQIEQILASDMS